MYHVQLAREIGPSDMIDIEFAKVLLFIIYTVGTADGNDVNQTKM